MLSITLLLVLAAFAVTIGSAMGRMPLWVAVLLLVLLSLMAVLPR